MDDWLDFGCRALVVVMVVAGCVACGSDGDGDSASTPAVDAGADAGSGAVDAVGADVGSADTGGADSSSAADSPTGPTPSGKACPLASRIGAFEVVHSEYGDWVSGGVKDRVDALGVLQAKEKEGTCQLWQRVNPHCEPKCDATIYQCTHDDGCQNYPVAQDVGQLMVTGLVKAVAVAAKGGAKKYTFSDFDDRAWKDGAAIALSAPGGDLGAIALNGVGVPPLLVPEIGWKIKAGTALPLAWTPAKGDWQVRISLNVDQHGLSPATLICEVDDSGDYTVSAKLVDALLTYGVSGAASALIERRTVDSTEVKGGCVELVVRSTIEAELSAL